MSQQGTKDPARPGRRLPWSRPTVTFAGTVADVLQGGGGKLSTPTNDTGDQPRKPKGQEGK